MDHLEDIIPFLLRAKRETYAGNGPHMLSSRPNSVDLAYREGDWLYIDTYLGGIDFAGEEAVWVDQRPIWSMNYYGRMFTEPTPDGFGEFLKAALRGVPANAPYRGPELFEAGRFRYQCSWEGRLAFFNGRETIALDGQMIYELLFHGGQIR